MSNAFDHENTIYGAYGEFDSFDVTADWTEQDWRDYDAHCQAEIAEWEAEQALAFYDEPDFF